MISAQNEAKMLMDRDNQLLENKEKFKEEFKEIVKYDQMMELERLKRIQNAEKEKIEKEKREMVKKQMILDQIESNYILRLKKQRD
jgi:hypothetical protein